MNVDIRHSPALRHDQATLVENEGEEPFVICGDVDYFLHRLNCEIARGFFDPDRT